MTDPICLKAKFLCIVIGKKKYPVLQRRFPTAEEKTHTAIAGFRHFQGHTETKKPKNY